MAKALGRQGRHVTVLERDLSEPNRIVGELLQPGGIEKLKQLGLEKCIEGIDGQEAKGYYVLTEDGESVRLPFPGDFKGVSFHHGRFIQNLRAAAKEEKR